MRLTADLIEQSAQYTNPVRDRELDLRGIIFVSATLSLSLSLTHFIIIV